MSDVSKEMISNYNTDQYHTHFLNPSPAPLSIPNNQLQILTTIHWILLLLGINIKCEGTCKYYIHNCNYYGKSGVFRILVGWWWNVFWDINGKL